MDIADFKKMSTADRLRAMEAIWDSLLYELYEDGEIESPKWHENELEERKKSIANGEAKFISLADLKANRKQLNNESKGCFCFKRSS